MTEFTQIATTADIKDGFMKNIVVGDNDILLASIQGKYYATQGRCPHMKGYLSHGRLNGAVVTCPVHGSQFDLRTGKVVRWVAGKGLISLAGRVLSCLGLAARGQKPLAVYEVKVENGRISAKIT